MADLLAMLLDCSKDSKGCGIKELIAIGNLAVSVCIPVDFNAT